MQIAFWTRQMVDLEPLHLFLDVFGRGQERRHGDERAQRFGNPAAKLEARQRNRANEKRDPSVDKRHARVNRANGAENRECCELNRAEPNLARAISGAARTIADVTTIAAA